MADIILLSGSPRTNGNTEQVLRACMEEIEKCGLEPGLVTLAGKDVYGCKACYACRGTGKCILEDCVNELADKLRRAKGFIYASPVYFGTARGDMMNLLQRIGMVSRGNDRFLSGMVGGPIAVARRGGMTLTLQEMLMFCAINEMIVPGAGYWNMVIAGKEKGECLQDIEGMETAVKFAGKTAELIKKLS